MIGLPDQAMVVRESMFQAFFKEWLDISSTRMTEGGLSWCVATGTATCTHLHAHNTTQDAHSPLCRNALPAYGTLMKHFLGQLMRSSMGHTYAFKLTCVRRVCGV